MTAHLYPPLAGVVGLQGDPEDLHCCRGGRITDYEPFHIGEVARLEAVGRLRQKQVLAW